MLASVLIRFICQVTFGLAASMLVTPSRLVTSGYYRVHLWVLLGFNTFATLLALTLRTPGGDNSNRVLAAVITAAVLSYAGSVCWLYESAKWGRRLLLLISATGLLGVLALSTVVSPTATTIPLWLRVLDDATAGLLLGSTLAAMFLGHWYLNTPTMELGPLTRLLMLMAVATVLRAVLCGGGAVFEIAGQATLANSFWAILTLRWLSGLVGTAVLTTMSWYTIKIPNTQSATGILYVAVIGVFLGELTSQFLSGRASYPL
jgi:hypothetical protein